MKDVAMGQLSWINTGMGPMVPQRGEERQSSERGVWRQEMTRKADAGRVATASCWELQEAENGLSCGNAALSTHLAQDNKWALF